MIYLNGKIAKAYFGGHWHKAAYLGSQLVWQNTVQREAAGDAKITLATGAKGTAAETAATEGEQRITVTASTDGTACGAEASGASAETSLQLGADGKSAAAKPTGAAADIEQQIKLAVISTPFRLNKAPVQLSIAAGQTAQAAAAEKGQVGAAVHIAENAQAKTADVRRASLGGRSEIAVGGSAASANAIKCGMQSAAVLTAQTAAAPKAAQIASAETGSQIAASAAAEKYDAFYDPDGNVLVSPARDELHVVAAIAPFSWTDEGYESLLTQMNVSSESISEKLDYFAAALMTAYKSDFEAIFAGAEKAVFLDEQHVCQLPSFLETDAHTFAGLRTALMRTFVGATWHNNWRSALFLDPQDHIEWEQGQDPTNFNSGAKAKFLYRWYPAVADGGPVLTAYNLQDPTGSMPTWENGFVIYRGDSGAVGGCCNAIPAYGVSDQLFMYAESGGIIARSDAAQTLPEAFLQQLEPNWTYGDLDLPAGWSITKLSSSVETEAVSGTALAELLANLGGIGKDKLPFAAMDEYTRSHFSEIMTQPYKKLGTRSFTIEFDAEAQNQ